MSFMSILETLVIGPLKLLFEFIFHCVNTFTNHPGLSIIVLSLTINILVLPLYRRADEMQKEARAVEEKLKLGVDHIKKVFSGDERMMILQTYYRQNNYKPTNALNGSVSLLLQIPFFMAAYQFLSNLQDLSGTSFGPIGDLSEPDGLIVIGGLAINLLPILMTTINFISSAIFLKGFPVKNKVQIYGMALVFLVLLYNSPSGLVFYWTLNNLFSLCKTIFYKIKNPAKVLRILISLAGIVLIALGAFVYDGTLKRKILIAGLGVAMQAVLLIPVIKSVTQKLVKQTNIHPNKKLFLAGSCFLTVLTGTLISSNVIAASPQEFVDITYFHNPLWYVLSATCMAAGTFLIWLRVFYWLAKPNLKAMFDKFVWILSGAMIVNYMFFGKDLGTLSPSLKYDFGIDFSSAQMLFNLLVMAVVIAVMYFIVKKWVKAVTSILLVATVALSAMSAVNIFTIKKSIDTISLEGAAEMPEFNLDKNGKNVVVIMLDRAIGGYVPYIFNENPGLKEKFDGFTYYSNTISFGANTNFALPALLGGYEYTPVELNKRDTQALSSKHNEALKVMPVLFNNSGYDVTVCDPVYANYSWIPDLSIYDEYEGIDAYITKGQFNEDDLKQFDITANYRNFFCFSLMKCAPVALQLTIYEGSNYRRTEKIGQQSYANQTTSGISVGKGYKKSFEESYAVLENLSAISKITNNGRNTFMFIANDTTHEPVLLQEPEYIPAYEIDNTKYDEENKGRFTLDGKTLTVSDSLQMAHYHINMAALIQVGNWLDYLKQNGVYDNTRIIIAADHGYPLMQNKDLKFDDPEFSDVSAENYHPLLMVKDFNSKGFTVSDEFMTNADVPTIATKDIINNPVNPFTGNPINSNEKTAHEQFIIVSDEFEVTKNNGNSFLPARWASVSEDLYNKNNWSFCKDETVLKEHKLP